MILSEKSEVREIKEKRVVIVSNRLPVSVSARGDRFKITPSIGGLATGLSSYHQDHDGLWVGWPGITEKNSRKRSELESVLLNNYNCLPVYLSDNDLKKYYHGFSNRTLWPLFHYFSTYSTYNATEWESYKKVNEKFCRRLQEVIRPGDLIWIHDYHLMLLPALLRKELPDATIGFFLHIPFPSFEVFRYLPWREEILTGVLGCDLIGFHTYDYTRHFLSSILRILGKDHTYGQVVADNRIIKVDTFPMGIDAQRYISASTSEVVLKEVKSLQKKLGTEKIIVSVDRLDFTKGIPERLRAFEKFLDNNPQLHGKITYVLLLVPSRTKVREYKLLKSEIDELVGRINGRFDTLDWSPILYLYRSLPFEKLVALYSAADLALVTPLRDGMNLVAKEYLACQSAGNKGTLVLSESAGAAAELGEAIIVNPNDLDLLAQSIAEGLEVGAAEKKKAITLMVERIKKYNVFSWAEDFVNQLTLTMARQDRDRKRFLADQQFSEVKQQYDKAGSRLLLLDYDGTLTAIRKRPDLAVPDAELLELLTALAEDPKNTVVIVSGRDREFLSERLSQSKVDLVAEHGAWIQKNSWSDWEISEPGLTDSWKQNIYPILEMFSVRTPGSFIEEKAFALAWHYRKTDPELGSLRAKELADSLHDIISGTDLQVLQGKKVLEIKPAGINKGKAVSHWLEQKDEWDFILAMGDDWTDEDIFMMLPDQAWSIKVGFTPFTEAEYFLDSPEKARKLLKVLSR
jgi:trehalose 6-phosphate synthase/phosphatase